MATETDYVKILRQKLGEFMHTMIDLHQRGIKLGCHVGRDCILTLIDGLSLEGEDKPIGHVGYPFNKEPNHANFYLEMANRVDNLTVSDYDLLKKFVNLIITSASAQSTGKKFNSESEERLLNVLLFNNGFPCKFLIKQSDGERRSYTELNPLYKMYMIMGNDDGKIPGVTGNHYTIEVPSILQSQMPDGLEKYKTTITDNKIQILNDGDCFYTAVSIWCDIYGITIDHLKSITYNVPFVFSEKHMNSNMKVRLSEKTEINLYPKPIEMPEFKGKAVEIAKNMIGKLVPNGEESALVNPIFNDEILDITNSKEYKAYLQDGVNKQEGTHCNKYKGNI